MEINDIIKSFSEKIGMEIVPSDDGVYMFEVDEMIITFHVLPELDEIVLTGDIGEPPPERLENLYTLEGNAEQAELVDRLIDEATRSRLNS